MKKTFKIIGVIFIAIVILIVGIFIYTNVNQLIKNNERKNSKTLTEYVRTHSWEYVGDSDKTIDFVEENLKCDILDNIKSDDIESVLSYGENIHIFLNDNSYISLLTDKEKLYSNNQNCIKTKIDIDIKEIKNIDGNPYIISNDNKLYSILYTNNKFDFVDQTDTDIYTFLLLNDDIKSVIYMYSSEAIILKKDNSLYKLNYKLKYNNGKATYYVVDEEIFISNKEYGNILNATMKYNYEDNKNEIDTLLTDKGYYYYGEVKTEECTKYQDIKCEEKMLESEIYKKFSKDIKYIGKEYTLLNDNSIIQTRYLTYPLDKDLK